MISHDSEQITGCSTLPDTELLSRTNNLYKHYQTLYYIIYHISCIIYDISYIISNYRTSYLMPEKYIYICAYIYNIYHISYIIYHMFAPANILSSLSESHVLCSSEVAEVAPEATEQRGTRIPHEVVVAWMFRRPWQALGKKHHTQKKKYF